jgi:phosphatidate phosphatase APP1
VNEWTVRLESLLLQARKHARSVARVIDSIGDNDPFEVLAYRGYGNASRAHVYGRALEKRNVSASTDSDSSFRNLLNTYRRADSDPLPFAQVRIEYGGAVVDLRADDEGFFSGWIEVVEPVTADDEWQKYTVSLVTPVHADAETPVGAGEILVLPASARFGVISDIDDTVIQSRVSNFLQAARTVMLGNARTRLPFTGVAAFYRALRDGASGGEKNPIYYVSSSPWNIYDVITEFMDIQKIPRGPLILRDWDLGWGMLASSRHLEHKAAVIRSILQLHPVTEFILIGDSSQHDPEIYRQIVAEFPKRIKAIYIRDVSRNAARSASIKKLAEEIIAAGSTLILAEDTLDAARHAAEQGWIDPAALPDVGEEKRADEGRDATKVSAPEGGKPTSGAPPVVIGDAGGNPP